MTREEAEALPLGAEFCLHPQIWFSDGDRLVRCLGCLREWEITDPARIQHHDELSWRSRCDTPPATRSKPAALNVAVFPELKL